MTLFPTFLGFSGRVGRLDFWLGAAAAGAVAWLCVAALARFDIPLPYASAAGDVAFLALFMGVAVKRGNDRGHAPADTLAMILAVIATAVALLGARTLHAPPAVTAGLTAVAAALFVLAVVDLGFMLPPEAPAEPAAPARADAAA